IVVGTFPLEGPDATREASAGATRSLTAWLEASGFRVYYAEVHLGARGRWRHVLAGAYTDSDAAVADALRLNDTAAGAEAPGVPTPFVRPRAAAAPRGPHAAARPSGPRGWGPATPRPGADRPSARSAATPGRARVPMPCSGCSAIRVARADGRRC